MISRDLFRDHCATLTERLREDPHGLAVTVVNDGRALLDRFHSDGELPDPHATQLTVALQVLYVRDTAWASISRDNAARRAVQWTRLGTSVPPVFTAPAAFLAGYAHFLAGNLDGALDALYGALTCQPDYRAAHQMVHMLCLKPDGYDMSYVQLPDVEPNARWLDPLVDRLGMFDLIELARTTA
ncbi:hypothetical protein ABH927_005708 [Planotetraspora sp. GP83]